jgi:hypothetical protein
VDRGRALRQNGKVFDLYDMEIEVHYQKPNYGYAAHRGTLEPNGLLPVFRVIPVEDQTLPGFAARWDGGNRDTGKERFELDTDIIRGTAGTPPDEEIKKFEREWDGYSGHHSTKLVVAEGHAYEVKIATPTLGRIFEAVVSFALHRKQEISLQSGQVVNLTKKVKRANTR